MTTQQRISLFVPSLRGGGAERVMVILANGFAARGLAVDLVAASADGAYIEDVSPAVRVVDLRASRVLFSLPALIRYLRQEQPYAMLSALDYANVVALWAKRISCVKTRIIVSEHNTLSVAYAKLTTIRAKLLPTLMRSSYRCADGIVAVSAGVANDLAATLNIARDRIQVVYNPVVTPQLLALRNEPISHPWLKENHKTPVIISVGRLSQAKDHKTLIYAFAELRRLREVRLVILGEGGLRSELEAMINQLNLREYVDLPGFVRNPFSWIRYSDVFALSSQWEGLGNVLIEAMACGTPVVSTDCPSGPAEILENGKWGKLVPVGDVNALAMAIGATLEDAEHPDGKKRAAYFDTEQAVSGYLKAMGVS